MPYNFQPTLSNDDEFIVPKGMPCSHPSRRHVQIVKRVPASHRQVGQFYIQRADEHIADRK